MEKPLKIYIAGPYSAETYEQRRRNVNIAIDASFIVLSKGHFPFIPHLTHFVDERAKELSIDLKWEDYIRWDLVWLRLCDGFLYLAGSRGADLELQEAKNLGKIIFYSIEEIPTIVEAGNRSKSNIITL
jgi:hypothetical protein